MVMVSLLASNRSPLASKVTKPKTMVPVTLASNKVATSPVRVPSPVRLLSLRAMARWSRLLKPKTMVLLLRVSKAIASGGQGFDDQMLPLPTLWQMAWKHGCEDRSRYGKVERSCCDSHDARRQGHHEDAFADRKRTRQEIDNAIESSLKDRTAVSKPLLS